MLHNILTVNCVKTKQYTKYLRQRSFLFKSYYPDMLTRRETHAHTAD